MRRAVARKKRTVRGNSPRLTATRKCLRPVIAGELLGDTRRLRPSTQGGPVYPAVYRIRPLADPEVAYAASGISSWRASTTSDCPSTETATWPPD
ncbi:hypothetical protein SAMN04487913_106216 [Arthrobacter sp. ok362]|nr:hypothetical protein SAMN04487913_106216 [Arthrobacter sp. ok362]